MVIIIITIFSYYPSSTQPVTTDITGFIKTVTLSCSKDQPSRKCEGTIAYPIFDKTQIDTQIGPGNIIWIIDNDTNVEIFRGIVTDRELDSSQELRFTAMDFMFHLLRSKSSYNFKGITPEQIVNIVANDVGVSTNIIATTGIPINRIIKDKSLYSIIMECYTEASKQNNKQYIPIMHSDKLNIIEKGQCVSGYTLQAETNIINLNYKDTIQNMVNRVKIYDDKGNYLSTVENSGWINDFGVLEDSYEVSKDTDTNTTVNNMLYGVDTDITVNALGNLKCITGYSIACKVFYISTLINATVYIDTDSHTWDLGNGSYQMTLTLNLSNLMDYDYDNSSDTSSTDAKSSSSASLNKTVTDTETTDTTTDDTFSDIGNDLSNLFSGSDSADAGTSSW